MVKFSEYETGLPHTPSLDIIDSTKLTSFMTCERRFFFEYVLGWRAEDSVHLFFGTRIHEALYGINVGMLKDNSIRNEAESLQLFIKNGMDTKQPLTQVIKAGMELLSETNPIRMFFTQFPPDELMDASKNRYKGVLALLEYVRRNVFKWISFEDKPLVEFGGLISISKDYQLAYKLDGLYEENGYLLGREFKTGTPYPNWLRQWETALQPAVYNMVIFSMSSLLNMKHGGVVVHGLLVNKNVLDDSKGADFKDPYRHCASQEIKITKSVAAMESLLLDIFDHLDRMRDGFICLEKSVKMERMLGFPRNYKFCSNFYGGDCEYKNICLSDNRNILRSVVERNYQPAEFEIRHWNPLDEVKEVAETVNFSEVS